MSQRKSSYSEQRRETWSLQRCWHFRLSQPLRLVWVFPCLDTIATGSPCECFSSSIARGWYKIILSPSTATQSSQPSSTVSAVTSGHTGMAELDCPTSNNTVVRSGESIFQTLCALHWPNNSPAINGDGFVSQIGSNGIWAYSLEECLNSCVAYNSQPNITVDPKRNGSGCLAITYLANLTNAITNQLLGNCLLKDRQGVYNPGRQTTESAILLRIWRELVWRFELGDRPCFLIMPNHYPDLLCRRMRTTTAATIDVFLRSSPMESMIEYGLNFDESVRSNVWA